MKTKFKWLLEGKEKINNWDERAVVDWIKIKKQPRLMFTCG